MIKGMTTRVMFGISLVWIAFAVFIACKSGFVDFRCLGANGPKSCLSPNEWGDVLAGVFSPLAFGWFVFTALMQTRELQLQREELHANNAAQLQRIEAQADAQHQPLLILDECEKIRHIGEGAVPYVHVFVLNKGSDVYEVSACRATIRNFKPSGDASSTTVPRGVLPWWPTDALALIVLENIEADSGDPQDREFSVVFTRRDTRRVANFYRFSNDTKRLILQRISRSESVN